MRSGSIDALKCLLAFMVVVIHTESAYKTAMSPITACAVPGFFLISGYFIFGNKMEEKLKHSLKRIIIITVWSSAIYAFLYFYKHMHHGTPSVFTRQTLIRFLLYNENPFIYHLWYLNAYIYVLIIILILLKLRLQTKIMVLIPVFIIADLFLGRYSHFLFGKDFGLSYIFGWLHDGLPYFLLGGFIKMCYSEGKGDKNANSFLLLCGCVLFTILSLAEDKLPLSGGDKYITTVFLTTCLFLYYKSVNIKGSNYLAKIGRRDSLYIYIFHPIIIDVLTFINAKTDILHNNIYPLVSPLVVFTITEFTICIYHVLVQKTAYYCTNEKD